MQYVIQWKSKVNGRTGKGTKLFEQDEAARLADELNREYPKIHHEPVPAQSAEPGSPPGSQPEIQSEPEAETAAPQPNPLLEPSFR
jgi:hypothetical protein